MPSIGAGLRTFRDSGRVARWHARLVAVLWLGVLFAGLLAAVSFARWRLELQEIRQLVATEIDAGAPPGVVVAQARAFIRDHVGYGRHGSYFLLPVFEFMRPTALQVIREGGDCAYRTRAFIVILRQFGVDAHKRALYDRNGWPVHAVAEVPLDGEPHYFDLLFNVAHVRADGTPLSLAELADEDVLSASIARAVAGGNEIAADYPIDGYNFDDVRTLNWDKNAISKMAYRVLVATIGADRARAVPRPYLSEEPALMVITLSLGSAGGLLVLIVLVRPRRRSPAGAPRRTEPRPSVAAAGHQA